MARSASFQQRYDDYLNHARRGLELSRSVHDLWGESNGLSEVAWALALLGHYEQAIADCQEALRLYRQVGAGPMKARSGTPLALPTITWAITPRRQPVTGVPCRSWTTTATCITRQ